jgi:hypothetical protein
MFTVSGSGGSGDLDDKTPRLLIFYCYILCIYMLTTSTNMYEKKMSHYPSFMYTLLYLSVWFQDIIFPATKKPL